jgi:hypothetical protein
VDGAGALRSRGPHGQSGTWRSLVAHLTGGQGVAGSNPVVPTVVLRVRGRFRYIGTGLWGVLTSIRPRTGTYDPERWRVETAAWWRVSDRSLGAACSNAPGRTGRPGTPGCRRGRPGGDLRGNPAAPSPRGRSLGTPGRRQRRLARGTPDPRPADRTGHRVHRRRPGSGPLDPPRHAGDARHAGLRGRERSWQRLSIPTGWSGTCRNPGWTDRRQRADRKLRPLHAVRRPAPISRAP